MRGDFEKSKFFMSHEFIGSSLLLVADGVGKTGVNIIDLAKTEERPLGMLDHRSKWVLGNHEDGCLFGLDNMISIWREVEELLRAKQHLLNDHDKTLKSFDFPS